MAANTKKIKKISGKSIISAVAIVVAIIYLMPIYLILVNSFKTNSEYILSMLSLPSGFNISESYLAAIERIEYARLFGNSIFVFCLALAGVIVLGSMTAYKLCRVKGKLSTVLFFIFLSCMIIPFTLQSL